MEPILTMLMENAMVTSKDIAYALNLEENEVEAKIQEYKDQGIILGFKAIIDTTKLEMPYATAMIEVKTNPKKEIGFDGVVFALIQHKEVESVYLMAGEYDLAVYVNGQTMQDIAHFVSRTLAPLDGVVSTSTHFLLEKYKESGVLVYKKEDPRESFRV